MSDTATVEQEDIKISKPKRYKVILLNDDYTTFEFVIAVLTQIFNHSYSSAVDLATRIHHAGSGVAGVYIYEIAEQKKTDVMTIAQQNGYPLQAKLEEDE